MPPQPPPREVNLLIVDDDWTATYTYARVLRPFAAVTIVPTVGEAIAWLERGSQCDAVLLLSTAHAYEAELLAHYLRHDRPAMADRLVLITGMPADGAVATDPEDHTTVLHAPVRRAQLLEAVRHVTQAQDTPSAELRLL